MRVIAKLNMAYFSLFCFNFMVWNVYASLNLVPVTHRTSALEHDSIITRIALEVKNRGHRKLSLLRSISQSHCPRPQAYKGETLLINIANLTRVIDIEYSPSSHVKDEKILTNFDAIVDVQSGITFEALVDALAPLGLIPAVVPEFKGFIEIYHCIC